MLSGICHQIPERCVILTDGRLAICYRCAGLFLGFFVTLLLLTILDPNAGKLPTRLHAVILGLFVLVWAVDGVNSAMFTLNLPWALYTPSHMLRLYTGTGMGFVLGTVLTPILLILWHENGKAEPIGVKWQHELLALLGSMLLAFMLLHRVPDSPSFWMALLILTVFGTLGTVNTLLVRLARNTQFTSRLWVSSSFWGIALAMIEMASLATIRKIIGV